MTPQSQPSLQRINYYLLCLFMTTDVSTSSLSRILVSILETSINRFTVPIFIFSWSIYSKHINYPLYLKIRFQGPGRKAPSSLSCFSRACPRPAHLLGSGPCSRAQAPGSPAPFGVFQLSPATSSSIQTWPGHPRHAASHSQHHSEGV